MRVRISKFVNLKTKRIQISKRFVLIKNLAYLWVCLSVGLLALTAQSLQWQARPGYRYAKVTPHGSPSEHGFEAIPSDHSRVTFINNLSLPRLAANVNRINGSGVGM